MKIVVLSNKRERLERIGEVLGGEGYQVFQVMGTTERLPAVLTQHQPDVIVLDTLCHVPDELQPLEQGGIAAEGISFIVLCDEMNPEFLLRAMRMGVREVLPASATAGMLKETLARIAKQIALAPGRGGQRRGKVLAFIPCKGGSGATFLATNLAYILAATENKSVALLDMNFQFGDALLFIHDKPPQTTMADVATGIQRLDASFLFSSMVHVLPNLHVLPAPEDPEHALDIKPEHVEALLQVAAAQFDYVVVDMGRVLHGPAVRAMDFADTIFPVLQQTLPFIRDAKRLLSTFRSLGYAEEKIHLLINRHEAGSDITVKDVENTLGMKVSSTVPNSFKAVHASVNEGVPILKISRGDPVTKALQELAHVIVEKG